MPVRLAASISMHVDMAVFGDGEAGSQTPQGWMVGPPLPSGPMQLRARAMMRAVVVLPTPRTPVSMKAWAMRPVCEGVGQGADQRFLPDQAGEIGRAVFARQHAIGSGGWRFGHVAH